MKGHTTKLNQHTIHQRRPHFIQVFHGRTKQRFPGTRATAHTSETVQAGRTSLLQQTPRVLCNHKYIRTYVLAPMKGSIWDEMTCYVSYYSNRRTGVTACHCGVHVRIVCTALHYSLQLLLCWCLCSGFHEPSLHKNTYVVQNWYYLPCIESCPKFSAS